MADVITEAPGITDLSWDQIRAITQGKEITVTPPKAEEPPKEKQPEQPQVEAPEAAAPEAPVAETAPDSEPEKKEQPRDENGKFSKEDELPAGVQKRIQKEINRTVAARKEVEQLAADYRSKLAELQGTAPAQKTEPVKAEGKPTPPDPAKFETYEALEAAKLEHTEKLAQWISDQTLKARDKADSERRQKEHADQVNAKFSANVAKAAEKNPDVIEAIETIGRPLTKAGVHSLVMESDMGPEIVLHLYQHQEDAARILALGDPMKMAREIGKIEAALAKPTTPAVAQTAPKPKTPLPKPPAALGGQGQAAEIDLDKADMRTFKAQRARWSSSKDA